MEQVADQLQDAVSFDGGVFTVLVQMGFGCVSVVYEWKKERAAVCWRIKHTDKKKGEQACGRTE